MTSVIFPGVTLETPQEWRQPASSSDSRLHQLAPYIGKLKPSIARYLLCQFTSPGDVVLDCFAGSGTVPLEASLLGRRVLAFDSNPYAITLTRAKLEAPSTLYLANEQLAQRLDASRSRPRYSVKQIPDWVQKFFHPETLQRTLQFVDECIEKDDQFLLACLLGILHHQRPGFLSFPSSHLVPYLRDRKFPREENPSLYLERDLEPRLIAKVSRVYKMSSPVNQFCVLRVGQTSVEDLDVGCEVDAIITSPPYMNALDYVRDNRLRMWFLDRKTTNYSPEPTEKRHQSDAITMAFARNALRHLRKGGYCVLIIGETVHRKRMMSHPAEQMFARLIDEYPSLHVEEVIKDEIPDIRRSRKAGSATKREVILVLRK